MSKEYEEVMKFAFMAGKVFTNEGNKKEEIETTAPKDKKKKNKKKK